MKILVPTDFSECADFALDAAVMIAKKLGGTITLFHSSSLPEDFKGINDDSEIVELLKEKLKINTELLFQQRVVKHKASQVNIDYHFHYGSYLDTVLDFDKKNNFDLFVVGSYGASGKQEWFIGSNTQKLVRKSEKNVLVVKNPIAEINFDTVLFPSNLTKEDEKAFTDFLEFVKLFGTKKVHILAVNTSGWFRQPGPMMLELLDDFKKLAVGFDCQTHFFTDYSVEAGIRHFSNEHDVKLIGISNYVSKPLKRIFQGSNVEMLVNHSDLPVLAINKAN